MGFGGTADIGDGRSPRGGACCLSGFGGKCHILAFVENFWPFFWDLCKSNGEGRGGFWCHILIKNRGEVYRKWVIGDSFDFSGGVGRIPHG